MDPVTVTHITVKADRLHLTVQLAPDAPRAMSPELAACVVAAVPTLPHHACVNDAGPALGAVLETTSVPHVLEHLIIDAQAHAALPATPAFVGTTSWRDEAAGLADIQVSYEDDIQALAAINRALVTLNAILQPQ